MAALAYPWHRIDAGDPGKRICKWYVYYIVYGCKTGAGHRYYISVTYVLPCFVIIVTFVYCPNAVESSILQPVKSFFPMQGTVHVLHGKKSKKG